ncbi:hypothetical protein [Massilia agri]|uniref:DUF2946 domain-containing protein n=1 Tax=Massilia agri TaxID=1886785 RepID=A0ABT2AMK9_9BURK|nr:hypothetical protein [Massilia agri]MCS0596973.1 hypothetical protein [Massilia agri]
MNLTVKTFLVWILMLMLPLHAVAASVGMSCAPVRQHASSGISMPHHQPAADADAHHGGDHAAHHAAAAADDDAPVPDLTKKAHSSCSACSALCAGAVAPPSVFLPLPSFDGSDAVNASPSIFNSGFIPDGPQRPPRHPSA